MTHVAIRVKNLAVSYGNESILTDISLEIPRGHLCAVVGPNGAGKTTLLKALVGLLPHVQGSVERYGTCAYVPQSSYVDWSFPLSVLDVVLMGSYGRLGVIKRPGMGEREQAYAALQEVGMSHYAHEWIGSLSGGQRQRILIARALMQNADILFLDEPFSAVDKITEDALIKVFRDLVAQNKTIVMVHHDVLTVRKVSDWVILVNRRIVAQGEPENVLTPENLLKTYGGYIA